MKKLIIRIILFIIGVYVATTFVEGISFSGWQALGLMGLVLALVHSFIKPIIKIITLPINIITFGLFALVINGVLFSFVGNAIPGFMVSGFVAAFWGGLIVAVVNAILDTLIDKDDD